MIDGSWDKVAKSVAKLRIALGQRSSMPGCLYQPIGGLFGCARHGCNRNAALEVARQKALGRASSCQAVARIDPVQWYCTGEVVLCVTDVHARSVTFLEENWHQLVPRVCATFLNLDAVRSLAPNATFSGGFRFDGYAITLMYETQNVKSRGARTSGDEVSERIAAP